MVQRFELGALVQIKRDAESIGHLHPMRFKAFRDARMEGHITDIGNEDQDPHPVEVEFSDNPLNRETMYFSWEELQLVEREYTYTEYLETFAPEQKAAKAVREFDDFAREVETRRKKILGE